MLLFFSVHAFSQGGLIRGAGGRLKQMGGAFSKSGGGAQGGTDSLKRRDKFEDSITIRFHYLDSTSNYKLDSSIDDLTKRFPIPATNIFLGNTGTASRSILFSPLMQPGWDPGFHAFDIYKYKLEKVRFFNTTRPYSELNYMLASRAEQLIEILHTQNIKPNWNFLLQYRLTNAPGFFKNQKTNHNNYLFTTWYQTINKRYNLYLVLLGNKMESGENGGIQDTTNFIDKHAFRDRFTIPTKIGGDPPFGTNFFTTDVGTGNRYHEFTVLLRQQYDFGQKDSVVTDSTVIPLFYPRVRFEHTLQYSSRKYNFRDYVGDSTYYKDNYDITLPLPIDTFQVNEVWKEITNDFSIYQFPDAKNLRQFFKVGAAIQNISLENLKGNRKFYNVYGHAEYRNRTRDQKWDLRANGILYFTGLNSGDYYAAGSLERSVGKKTGYAQLAFENVNKTPSFIFDQRSQFYLQKPVDFKKENISHLSASLYQPFLQLKLTGDYYLVTNYTYITDYFRLQQEGTLFNMLQVSAQKTISLGKSWKWHADVYFQKLIGNAPVHVPVIFTRNRIGYEGKLGFKNLNIAFGAEIRYHTPYKADGYSPVLGQFYYQDSIKIDNPMPDIAGYLNFRIRSFKFYLRAENLNSARDNEGFGFTNNNFAAPNYPYPGLVIRIGIYWSFVN
ncbi:MAG: putative porin [Chitinophagaceae bacterium]